VPSLAFTFDEGAALYLGRVLLQPMAGSPFWEAARQAWNKIRVSLGEFEHEYVDRFSRFFYSNDAEYDRYDQKANLLDQLSIAIEENRVISILYRSQNADQSRMRKVYPLALLKQRTGALYLMAHAPEHDEARTYKLDRIEQVELQRDQFQQDHPCDLKALLRGSMGVYVGDGDYHVVVRFSPPAARHAYEEHWHASVVKALTSQGELILELNPDPSVIDTDS